ncbi:MAG: flavin reductase family protein [candidate division WOR-3 bacterium]
MAKAEIKDFSSVLRKFPCFPCVLVTTQNNIITIGMVHIFSFAPPLVGIGVSPRRYSFNLLKQSKEYVINIPTKDLLTQVAFCGEKSGRDCDKFEKTGLTKQPSLKVKTPSIAECPLNIECKIINEIETGDHTWFIGEVVAAHIDSDYDPEETILYWGGHYRVPGTVIGKRY